MTSMKSTQIKNLIWHVNFLHKEVSAQRNEIQQRKATEERQKAIIKYLKAELKELQASMARENETKFNAKVREEELNAQLSEEDVLTGELKLYAFGQLNTLEMSLPFFREFESPA